MVCFLLARHRDERVGVEVFGDAWILPGDRKKRSALSSESESLAWNREVEPEAFGESEVSRTLPFPLPPCGCVAAGAGGSSSS